jgi:hypothetical protein
LGGAADNINVDDDKERVEDNDVSRKQGTVDKSVLSVRI